MAQGTRVSGNLFHDNATEDMFVEVDHGPFLVDNNLFLSPSSLLDMSEGGAYAHNLMTGKIDNWYDMGRLTPYMQPHSTAIAGLAVTQGGDNRSSTTSSSDDGLPGEAPVQTDRNLHSASAATVSGCMMPGEFPLHNGRQRLSQRRPPLCQGNHFADSGGGGPGRKTRRKAGRLVTRNDV